MHVIGLSEWLDLAKKWNYKLDSLPSVITERME